MLGESLKKETTGCKLEVISTSSSRKMTAEQRQRVAQLFLADFKSVSASREVISKKLEVVKNVYKILSATRAYWKAYTIKYEDGVRLIRTNRIVEMSKRIEEFQAALQECKQELKDRWEEVKEDAKVRLADLYVEADYQLDPMEVFWLTISYPAIEPDDRIKQLAPDLYAAEKKRIEAKFEDAACLAEEAMRKEFKDLVDSMVAKLATDLDENGKKKVLKEAALDNLVSFAERFKAISVSNDEDLDAMVLQVKALAGGVSAKDLKDDAGKKAEFAEAMAKIKDSMETLITTKPVRKFELD
jgi:hypothetical protein